MKQPTNTRYISALSRIRGKITLSKIALWLEVLSRRFWPVLTLGLFAYAFTAFGGFTLLSAKNGTILIAAITVLALVLAVFALRQFQIPSQGMALDRLDEGMDGHPIATLRDQSATGENDDLTQMLWDRHQQRMVDQAVSVQPSLPDLRLASRDKFGLRLMALVLGFAAITFAPRDAVQTLQNVLTPSIEAAEISISYEAWANPPAYTGKPAVYMLEVASDEKLLLPEGTELVIRVYGLVDETQLEETVSGESIGLSGEQEGLKSVNFNIEQAGIVRLMDGEDELASWQISIEPDHPPSIILTEDPSRNGSGAMQMPFEASDDYGVVSGTAVITLDLPNVDRRYGLLPDPVEIEPITLELPMPFSGKTDIVVETLIEDLSEHLWANLPATIELTIVDAAGQEGYATITTDSLPAKRFYVPIAAAFAEQRRDLLWSSDNDLGVLPILKAATFMPEDLQLSASSYLMVRTVMRRLEYMLVDGLSEGERTEITDLLWEVANRLEEGDLSDARERLRRAQERLAKALEENADQAELDQLMEELREATEDYLQALSDEAQQNGDMQQADSNNPTITQDEIQEMMDRIQELMDNSQTAEAQELLEELQQLLENLQMTDQQAQGEGQGQGEAGEQMQEMQDALDEQQGLSDDTFQQLQESLSGENEPRDSQELADRQEALRELLEEMQEGAAGRERVEDAERNMGEARDRLEEGDTAGALDRQAEAIENMREGIRELAEEMQQGEDGGTGDNAGQRDTAEVDPLGRPLGDGGGVTTGDEMLQNESAIDRARELLDEIRRRSGETERPAVELDYLDRLLDRF